MPDQTFKPGDRVTFASDSPTHPYSAFFEDDGETGYFYAMNVDRSENMILDAVHIYNVANVSDRQRLSSLSIVWSNDGLKCALLINDYPHAAFDSPQREATVAPTFRISRPRLPIVGRAATIAGLMRQCVGWSEL